MVPAVNDSLNSDRRIILRARPYCALLFGAPRPFALFFSSVGFMWRVSEREDLLDYSCCKGRLAGQMGIGDGLCVSE